jgi:hypothetical protein
MVWLFLTASGQAQEEAAASRALMTKEKEPQQKGQDEVKMQTKTLSGEISARGPSGIALVYETDMAKRVSKEMWFPFEKPVKFNGYKDSSEISEGDRVTVTYVEAEDKSIRILTAVRLNKKAKPPQEEQIEDPEEKPEAGQE